MESEEKWHGSGKRWSWLILASIAIIALCAMSCKSPKGLTQTHRSDSLAVERRFEQTLVPIPMSISKLTLPMTDLTLLPPGTGYNQRSGQATVDVRRGEGDSIIVTATCDSLARQVLILTEELTRIRNETTQVDKPPEVIREPTGWQWFQIWIGRVEAAVLAGYLLYRVIKQYLNKKNIRLWQKK